MIKATELFCGTKSFSKVAACKGYDTFTSDVNKRFKPDYLTNIFDFDTKRVPYRPHILWASHPCTFFSVASMWKHWNKDHTPKSLFAVQGMKMVDKMLEIIYDLSPDVFYIENPVGMMRHLPAMQHLHRVTITYCCYGDNRMKPTDIFTNDTGLKLLDPCGFKKRCTVTSSTNDLHTPSQRSVIPPPLIEAIIRSFENYILPGPVLGKILYCRPHGTGEIKFQKAIA